MKKIAYIFIAILLVFVNCKNKVDKITDPIKKTVNILTNIYKGENKLVLDEYFEVEMNSNSEKNLTQMNDSVLQGLKRYGFPKDNQIVAFQQNRLPVPAKIKNEFASDSMNIIISKTHLGGKIEFIEVEMFFVETKNGLRLFSIGTEAQSN